MAAVPLVRCSVPSRSGDSGREGVARLTIRSASGPESTMHP